VRPRRLSLEGFGTFRERTEVDFDDLDLVAIVGPTGSGKSTILDAITFALYGSVPRYDNAGLVAPAIHQLSTEAKVSFDFDLGGETYRAVRVVRRAKSTSGKARATTKEARLERLDFASLVNRATSANPDTDEEANTTPANGEVLAGSVGELDAQVEELLGLDFRQFTRTIVLPQGTFAEFLTDDPSNRQKLLRRLLDMDIYARMGQVARERISKAETKLEVLEPELERLAEIDSNDLTVALAAQTELTDFASTVDEQLTSLDELDTSLGQARDQVNEFDRVAKLLTCVEIPADLDQAAVRLREVEAEAAQAEAAVTQARQLLDNARATADKTGDVVAMREQLGLHARLAEVDADIVRLVQAESEASKQVEATEQTLTTAEKAASESEATRAEIAAAADAEQWVSRLVKGEPCPVCQQPVHDIPHGVEPGQLTKATDQAKTDRLALQQAETAKARAAGNLDGATKRHQAEQARRYQLSAQLQSVPEAADLKTAITEALDASSAREAAEGHLRGAESVHQSARAARSKAESSINRLSATFTAQRDQVAELRPPPLTTTGGETSPRELLAPPGGEGDDGLAGRWWALADWAKAKLVEVARQREQTATEGKALAARKAELHNNLMTSAAAVGLAVEPNRLAAELAREQARRESAIAVLTDRLDRKAELQQRIDQLKKQRQIDVDLGRRHLRSNGFERWLLTEALEDMVARATERLFDLSGGRYSLEAVDGSFTVRDHANANERRDVRTLSGGEIFLASLSLALALADSIAELAPVDSPRLESIFLDEGFGTLDAETLDTLASAIEELSADGRLVVVITHVRDLAERMPVRFEVRKDSNSSSVERVEL